SWGMQFLWPFKMDYRIVYLDKDYNNVIIGREARDYVWIMSRQPTMSDNEYSLLTAKVEALGYDTGKLVKVPQKW
ncbi:MAG: lipocalin family protein, partial [Arenicella sp.]|nr:lipocalin family protein [Arenicella sp.]